MAFNHPALLHALLAKRQRRRNFEDFQRGELTDLSFFDSVEEHLHADWDHVDLDLLSLITGRHVTPDEMGMIPEHLSSSPKRHSFTEKDMETYEQLTDLFWWYCKMDVYQSVLGGTRLLYVNLAPERS